MKLFISGNQTEDFVLDTLGELDSIYDIKEICGSILSPCMTFAVPWAEENGIYVSMHMVNSDSKEDIIATNINIINIEEPHIILMYDEEEDIADKIIQEANDCKSVECVMRKVT